MAIVNFFTANTAFDFHLNETENANGINTFAPVKIHQQKNDAADDNERQKTHLINSIK